MPVLAGLRSKEGMHACLRELEVVECCPHFYLLFVCVVFCCKMCIGPEVYRRVAEACMLRVLFFTSTFLGDGVLIVASGRLLFGEVITGSRSELRRTLMLYRFCTPYFCYVYRFAGHTLSLFDSHDELPGLCSVQRVIGVAVVTGDFFCGRRLPA